MTKANLDLLAMFEPYRLNNITLQSRFIMPAMNRGWTVDDLWHGRIPAALVFATFQVSSPWQVGP